MNYTNDELSKMIAKGKFPKSINQSQKLAIRDLWLEGKDEVAFRKLRDLIGVPVISKQGKTLL